MKSEREILKKLSLREKIGLLEGVDSWKTREIPRLGVRALYLTDGPLGVRKKATSAGRGAVGLGRAKPATLFPAPATLASSFDPALSERVGRAMGREARAYGVDVLLAPAMNVKRDPRCGRNFEYYSEDPLLTGKMAAGFARGVESAGAAACLKHFALNNTESFRYMRDSIADERAMREIYLRPFEIAVREGKPRAVMCSYNKINGIHASENRRLLTDLLRKEWGFRGLVMTDWGATRDRVAGVKAGCDLDMPGGLVHNREALFRAVREGKLSEKTLNKAVLRVLRLVLSFGPEEKTGGEEKLFARHRALSRRAAEESMTLLANDGLLPLGKEKRILAVGGYFRHMRAQGAGSSSVNPRFLTEPETAFRLAGIPYRFAEGYYPEDERPDPELENEALRMAEEADAILLFLGLGRHSESEGADRKTLSLPENQISLLKKLHAAGKKTAIVLFGGGVVDAEPLLGANAVLYAALPGGEGGEAIRRVLYGESEPGGRLAESWIRPRDLLPLPSDHRAALYRESLFVGYRYFASRPGRVLFPFGHGLSYTSFALSGLKIDGMRIGATLENTGSRPGGTVVQLYLGWDGKSAAFGEAKKLVGFQKLRLSPGEKKTVSFALSREDLAWYHARLGRYVVEKGIRPVEVGFSSEDIRLKGTLAVEGEEDLPAPVTRRVKRAYERDPRRIPDRIFAELLERELPAPEEGGFDLEAPLSEAKKTGIGRVILSGVDLFLRGRVKSAERLPRGKKRDELLRNRIFIRTILFENSLRSMIQSSGGAAQMELGHALVHLANGRYGKLLKTVFRA